MNLGGGSRGNKNMTNPLSLTWGKYLSVHIADSFGFLIICSTCVAWAVTCVYREVSSVSRDMYMKCNRRIFVRRQTPPPPWSFSSAIVSTSFIECPLVLQNQGSPNVHINNSLMCPRLYREITARDVALLNRNASKAACKRDTLELTF